MDPRHTDSQQDNPLFQPSQTWPQNPSSQASDEILLGRYRVLARRGTGGFGSVCTCWDTTLQRRVAIKRIPLTAADETGIQASTMEDALGEARTACLLNDPNIVTVHDFQMDGAYAYLVMEYIDGLNLAELLGRVEGGVLTHEECCHVLTSCAHALTYAHQHGVLHLDVKPTNIMINREGTVKLTDFGMATLASATGYAGARGGTVGYMPPEQIEGMLVDERADVFSLAVVIWQALTGTDPFAATSAAASLEAIFRGPRKPLTEIDPELDFNAEDALLRALAPGASGRTPSANELACELAPSLGDAAQGAASLRDLLDQSKEDDAEKDLAWADKHIPLRVKFPWLWPALERTLPALLTLICVLAAAPSIPAAQTAPMLLVAVGVYAATAAWPPVGSLLAVATASVALACAHPNNLAFPLAAGIAVAGCLWWAYAGRRDRLATAALLLPCCLGRPIAGAQLAGFALDPLEATLTGAAAALLTLVFNAAISCDFAAGAVIAQLAVALTTPATWVLVAGSAAAAAASCLVAMRGSVRAGIAGQGLGLAVLLAFEVFAARVENGGFSSGPIWVDCLYAVLLFVVLCGMTVLRGPLFESQEGEE